MKFLVHAGEQTISCLVGHLLYNLEPKKPLRINEDFDAGIILQEKGQFGVVEVEQAEDDNGIHLDVESALEKSLKVAEEGELKFVKEWADGVTQDFAIKGKSVPAPFGRVKEIIDRRGINVKATYGIDPIGATSSAALKEKDEEIVALKGQLANAQAQNTDILKRLQRLEENSGDADVTDASGDAGADGDDAAPPTRNKKKGR